MSHGTAKQREIAIEVFYCFFGLSASTHMECGQFYLQLSRARSPQEWCMVPSSGPSERIHALLSGAKPGTCQLTHINETGGSGGGGGGGVYSESYIRRRFLTRWDQHAVAQRGATGNVSVSPQIPLPLLSHLKLLQPHHKSVLFVPAFEASSYLFGEGCTLTFSILAGALFY